MPLGLSQHAVSGVAPWAATIGTVGLSGAVVLTNVVLAGAVAMVHVPAWRWPAAATAAAVVALLAGGATGRGGDAERAGELVLRLGLVQGHVAPAERASPYDQARVLLRYERLSAEVAPAADLVVWPEAAVPFYFGSDGRATRRIRTVARRHARPLLFGSAAVERLTPTTRRYTNRAVLLGADGSVGAIYTKRRLVPFGERVPFARWLPVRGAVHRDAAAEPAGAPSGMMTRRALRVGRVALYAPPARAGGQRPTSEVISPFAGLTFLQPEHRRRKTCGL
jgi:apolipoprotein N-acyltransferase